MYTRREPIYHGNRTGTRLFLSNLEVQEGAELLGVLKVQLIEAADSRQEHAVVELLHVAARLQHDGWIGRTLILHGTGIQRQNALG